MESISSIIKLPVKKKGSERAELIKFFVENITDKKGKKYKPSRIAVLLSPLIVKDLYYLQSVFKDIQNRKGIVYAQKWFWWSIRGK